MTLNIALAQTPVIDNKEQNLRRAEEAIGQAARDGAQLVALPEMFTCPYGNEYFRPYSEPVGGETWSRMSAAAKAHGVYLVAGSFPEQEGEKLFNTCFVFDPEGRQIARHRKMHLFDIDVKGGQRFFESDTFAPGQDVTLFDTPFGRMGLCICFDMRFPELSRLMALGGAQVIFAPAAFNMTTGPAHWEITFRQRALDNQVFTVGVSPARDLQGCYVAYGNSLVCSPWGDVVCRAGYQPQLLYAQLDLDAVGQIRSQLPLLSARRTDVYTVCPTKTAK